MTDPKAKKAALPPKPTKKEREALADRAVARSAANFVKRRPLDRGIALAAAGAGLGAGLVTAYLAAIWLARAPLAPDGPPSRTPAGRPPRRRPAE